MLATALGALPRAFAATRRADVIRRDRARYGAMVGVVQGMQAVLPRLHGVQDATAASQVVATSLASALPQPAAAILHVVEDGGTHIVAVCGCVAVWLCGCVAVWLCGCVAAWLRGCGCFCGCGCGCGCGCVACNVWLLLGVTLGPLPTSQATQDGIRHHAISSLTHSIIGQVLGTGRELFHLGVPRKLKLHEPGVDLVLDSDPHSVCWLVTVPVVVPPATHTVVGEQVAAHAGVSAVLQMVLPRVMRVTPPTPAEETELLESDARMIAGWLTEQVRCAHPGLRVCVLCLR